MLEGLESVVWRTIVDKVELYSIAKKKFARRYRLYTVNFHIRESSRESKLKKTMCLRNASAEMARDSVALGIAHLLVYSLKHGWERGWQ